MQSFSGGKPDTDCIQLELPHFHSLLPMQSFSGWKPDIYCIGFMANSIFLRGKQRKRVWIVAYCQTIPPPPTKGECLECARVTLLRPTGRWRGDTVGEQGRSEDIIHNPLSPFPVFTETQEPTEKKRVPFLFPVFTDVSVLC